MSERAVLEGSLSGEEVPELLARIEELCTTGLLRFRGDGVEGAVALVRGELATDQPPMDGGRDPVDVLLSLGAGRFELVQRLPPLAVSQGDARRRSGSLAVHVPADLMRYCEQAGLTGTLRFEQAGRTACAVYDRGELVGIRVDGREDADLHRVFGWEEGTFTVEARPLRPTLDEELELDIEVAEPEPGREPTLDPIEREPTIPRIERRRDETGQHFLTVMEVTLSKVLEDRESYRPPSRSSPPLPRLSSRRPRPAGGARPAGSERARGEDREPTVKIVYHSRTEEPLQGPRRAPRRGSEASEEAGMANESERPESSPGAEEQRAAGESAVEAAPPVHAPTSAGDAPPAERTTLLGTAAWIAVIAALALFTVRLLAWLSPLG